MKINLPLSVNKIILKLEEAGYEAYAVGGCVRDSLLGRTPDDWDITTSAKPSEVKALFRRTIDTGIKHGTVTIMDGSEGYEVTTYRIDGEYEDGRHPKEVTFTRSLEEDLKRRDFTINAMDYSEKEGLVDLFGGQADLEKKIIRCVGNPVERFSEDALRMMRAVRFAGQLSFTIDEATKEAVRNLSKTLSKVSSERIQIELVKLLVSPNPDYFEMMYDLGLTAVFMPEFDRMMETAQNHPHHAYSVGVHTLKTMKAIKSDRRLRLAMLFHDSGKPAVKTTDEDGTDHFHGHPAKSGELAVTIMRRLKFDTDTINYVRRLAENHDRKIGETEKDMRRAMNKLGEDIFPDLFEVKAADIEGQSMYLRNEKEEALKNLRIMYEKVCASNACVSLKDLNVKGKDLMELGMSAGRGLGETLNSLLELVIENPDMNDKETLINWLKDNHLV